MTLSPDMMKIIGSFTPLRVSSMAGMVGFTLSKKDLMGLNGKLNRVKLKTSALPIVPFQLALTPEMRYCRIVKPPCQEA